MDHSQPQTPMISEFKCVWRSRNLCISSDWFCFKVLIRKHLRYSLHMEDWFTGHEFIITNSHRNDNASVGSPYWLFNISWFLLFNTLLPKMRSQHAKPDILWQRLERQNEPQLMGWFISDQHKWGVHRTDCWSPISRAFNYSDFRVCGVRWWVLSDGRSVIASLRSFCMCMK